MKKEIKAIFDGVLLDTYEVEVDKHGLLIEPLVIDNNMVYSGGRNKIGEQPIEQYFVYCEMDVGEEAPETLECSAQIVYTNGEESVIIDVIEDEPGEFIYIYDSYDFDNYEDAIEQIKEDCEFLAQD